MDRKESLKFLQECIDKIDSATPQDIQFYRKMYEVHCDSQRNNSDFEFIPPVND